MHQSPLAAPAPTSGKNCKQSKQKSKQKHTDTKSYEQYNGA